MLKKLIIAAVAVVAGLAVLNLSLVKVWWKDCCHSARNMVPPEVQLKQLNSEIGNIDKDIKKNIGRLAAMEVEVKQLEKDVKGQRVHMGELKSDITALQKSLEDRSSRVAKLDGAELTRKLDRTVTTYTSLKEKTKVQDKLLEEKKRTLDAAHARLTEMFNEKEKLTLLSARLAGHIEATNMKTMGTSIEFDNSAITRCHEIAKDIETRLDVAEHEHALKTKYYGTGSASAVEEKSREDVLKAARKALEEDNEPATVAVDKEEK
jgi:septal ring factor EnvC (AmiA/AmiB activator)